MMTCSCQVSEWMRGWLGSFGAEAPYVAAALLLLWWARKSMRREHFGQIPIRKALAYNLPALGLFLLGAAVLLLAQIMR